MTNQMVTFTYENTTSIRTMVDDQGEPLFCLADVCGVLELTNPTHTANALKEEFETPTLNVGVIQRDTGPVQATFITEPQLYFVMMRSRSDKAKPFRQWVVNEVLPSIRKTGRYEAPKVTPATIQLKELVEVTKIVLEPAGIKGNQLTLALDKVVKKKTGESALTLAGVQLEAPQQEHLANPTQLGRQIGSSAIKINRALLEAGLQYKNPNDEWTPTPEGLDLGATLLDVGKAHSDGTPIRQLKWPYSILDVIQKYL